MKAYVIYESMFGSTHAVARAIASGLAETMEVHTLRVTDADHEVLAEADLVVVGGPTHAHGRSHASTRKGARDYLKEGSGLALEPGADEGPGVRDLAPALAGLQARGAAFDTRVAISPLLSGRASKGIARELEQAGLEVVAEPESFLVDKGSHLLAGELERATEWGRLLAGTVEVHHVH
jgi:hypothetical protein